MALILASFHLSGSSPVISVLLKIILWGVFSSWCRVFRKYGCNPSGPHDLFLFSWLSSFPTSSSWMRILCILCSICLFSISGSGPWGSLVNTLQKFDCNVSAFSFSDLVSSNITAFGSFISSGIPSFTLYLDFIYFQANLGLTLMFMAVLSSNFLLSFFVIFVTLFLALQYALWFSSFLVVIIFFHSLCLSLMIFTCSFSSGMFPFVLPSVISCVDMYSFPKLFIMPQNASHCSLVFLSSKVFFQSTFFSATLISS